MPEINLSELKIPEEWLPLVIDYATAVLFAFVIFIVGRMVVGRVVNICQKVMLGRGMDETLVSFITSILRWVGLLFVAIASLSRLGIDTTSLVALLGAAGLAIGLSLQNSLGNLAAGVMLILFKPFKKGDFVEAGLATGTVEKISIFTTVMTTPDNKEIIVPNGAIIGNNITNFSARPTRRVDMVFGIAYDDDLKQAKDILEDIVKSDTRVLAEPAPVVTVGELADSSVNFLVRPWVDAADYWSVLWDTTEAVKLRFDEAGISIPFPQMELHMQKQSASEEPPASPKAA